MGGHSARLLRRIVLAAAVLTVVSCNQAPNPPNDHAPTIAAFESAPNPAVQGHATMLQWAVSDVDGDTLTCTVEPGDGTASLTIPDCGATTSRPHTYAAAGTYTPILTVDDGNGGTATATTTVHVEDPTPGNANPTVTGFAAHPNPVYTNDPLSFSWAVGDADGDPVQCTLDPGDGHGSIAIGNCVASTTHTYSYGHAGSYAPTLTADDGRGGITMATISVAVADNAAPSITGFMADPNPTFAGSKTTFSWSVDDPEGGPVRCSLVPGDGSSAIPISDCTSTVKHAYTYTSEGTYPARLTATDDHGQAVTEEVPVVVQPNPPPTVSSFAASPNPSSIDSVTTFSWHVTDNDVVSCTIDFGDGLSQTVPGDCRSVSSIGHIYRLDGTYKALLAASDGHGGVTKSSIAVTVKFDYSGSWRGTVYPTGASIGVTATIEQNGTSLKGTWSADPPYDFKGPLTGTTGSAGAKIVFSYPNKAPIPSCQVTWVATRGGRTLKGPYTVSQTCAYEAGTLTMTKLQ